MHLATSELRECEPQLTSALTSWPKCCDLRLCGLQFCERRIGSAMDSLHELLRAAPCRLRTCEDGKRRKIGASVEPAQKSAPCELRGARCDRRNRTACATVCELRAVLCELQSCLSTCLASMLRAAICETTRATWCRTPNMKSKSPANLVSSVLCLRGRGKSPHPPYRSQSKGRPDDRTVVFLVCC